MADYTTSPLRQMRGPYVTDPIEQATQEQQLATPSGALQRGFQSSLTGMSAALKARDALNAEQAGLPTALGLRATAGDLARQAEMQAPEINSFRQINGVGDAAEYAAGAIGGMAPYVPVAVAGAAAGRMLPRAIAPAIREALGSSAAMYPFERGQSALEQYQDPVQAAAPVQQRSDVATTRGVINAGLLGGAASSVLRGVTGRALGRGIIGGGLEAAAPMVASGYVGQEAQNYLNPQRDTSHDTDALIDAGIQGFGLGAAGHLPSSAGAQALAGGRGVFDAAKRGVQKVQENLPAMQVPEPVSGSIDSIVSHAKDLGSAIGEKAKGAYDAVRPKAEEAIRSTGDHVDDAIAKFADATRDSNSFADFVKKTLGSDSQDLENLSLGDKSPEFKGADGQVDADKLLGGDAQRSAKAEGYAKDLMEDPATSDEVKAKVASFGGDFSKPEAQKYVADTLLGQRAGQKVGEQIKNIRSQISDLMDKMKEGAADLKDKATDAIIKKSSMETSKSELAVEKTVRDHLRNELNAQPAVQAQVPELAKALVKLMARGKEVNDQELKSFGGFRGLDDLFTDPSKAMSAIADAVGSDKIYQRYLKFNTAYEDSKRPDSFLYKAIPPERREAMDAPMLRKLGEIIDAAGDIKDSKKYAMLVDGLVKEVYGSRDVARSVVDYYGRQNKADMKPMEDPRSRTNVRYEEGVDDGNPNVSYEDRQGMSTGEPQRHDYFNAADPKIERPYHATELHKLTEKLQQEEGPTGRGFASKMSNFVFQNERDAPFELKRIEKDINGRIAEHEGHKEFKTGTPEQKAYRTEQIKALKDQLAGIEARKKEVRENPHFKDQPDSVRAETEANAALQDFYVGHVEGERGDKRQWSQALMREAKAGNKMTKDKRDARANEFFKVEMRGPDGNVKEETLHAPSLVFAMSKRDDPVRVTKVEMDESPGARSLRLLKEGLASLQSDPHFVAFKTPLSDIAFHEGKRVRDAEAEAIRSTKEKMTADEFLKEANNTRKELEGKVEEANDAIEKTRGKIEEAEADGEWVKASKLRYSMKRDEQVLREYDLRLREHDNDVKKAQLAGGKFPEREMSEKQQRKEQGFVVDQRNKESADFTGRVALERGDVRREGDGRTSSGVYTNDQPNSLKVSPKAGRAYDPEHMNFEGKSGGRKRPEVTTSREADILKSPVDNPLAKRKGAEIRGESLSKKSAQTPAPGHDMTPEQAQAVRDHVLKTRGPDVKVLTDEFAASIGGSGEYYKNGADRVIKVARDALNPLSVAFHESMHDFFHTLMNDGDGRAVKDALLRNADRPYVQSQLRVLLRDHPDAMKQIMKDPEERLAYMYQFWAADQLRLSADMTSTFRKATKWLRDVLGVVTQGEQGEAILSAFHDGRLADPSTAGAIIADLHMKTVGDRARKIAGPLAKLSDTLVSPATERLHSTGISAYKELAEMFHKEPGRENGELGFIQRRNMTSDQMYNKLADVVGSSKREDVAIALKDLQAMRPPTTELGRQLQNYLGMMHDYMVKQGVQNSRMVNGKPEWVPLQKVSGYFPRVWDRNLVRAGERDFKNLLMQEGGLGPREAEAIFKTITSGDGMLELAETEHHVGFTPYSSAVKNRQLTFINPANAERFAAFQSKDLVHIMQTYTYQAVHRGEYAKFFGNDGEKIQTLLLRGKREGASEKEMETAARAVRAMEGTLGAEINPRLRELYSTAVGYENIVLLPFALFSSLIDPLGVAVRSGKLADAAIAFKDGIKGVAQDLLRLDKGGEYEMAKTVGVIGDLTKLEALGQTTSSQYMGKWLRTFNDKFFKWNGMETWNERMRVSAMGAGMRFMVRNKENARYMEELGLQKSDIRELSDGRIARTTDEGLTAEQEKRVQEALYKFVDGAMLRPNAAHRAIWASDPHYMLISHLKQYTWSFQQTILKQVNKELKNDNYVPLLMLASYVPFMAASDMMRATITGSHKAAWTLGEFIQDGVARSGILGTASFGAEAFKDAAMGNMPGSSFLGPTAQHAIMAAKTVAGAPGTSWHDLILRSMPASPLSKAIE